MGAPAPDLDPNVSHQWNISVQKSLPGDSALTLAYVGNRGLDLMTQMDRNAVPPGLYPNLQAAKPYPLIGSINLYENAGESWYNALQLKLEKRFHDGISYMFSYSFSKHTGEGENSIWDVPVPFAPEGYNRGRSELDRTHILAVNSIWEVPIGRGRRLGQDLHPVANAILGGWQFSTIYNFISGAPLSFAIPGGTLGNGYNTRANQVGNPKLSDPTANRWFDAAAFAAPPRFTFGNSGLGIMDGPGTHLWDLSLMKNLYFSEARYLQFRWEMFNAPNHVNLSNPGTTIGISSTGRIFGAGTARQMQAGLKFIF